MEDTEIIAYHKVWWNHGNNPIFIAHEIIPHPSGLSARMGESKTIIMPGQGIDLTVLGLKPWRPDSTAKSE